MVTVPIDGLAAVPCPSCTEPLSLSQPDPDDPDRLVATCPACGEWFLLVTSSAPGPPTARAISLRSAFRTLARADRDSGRPLG